MQEDFVDSSYSYQIHHFLLFWKKAHFEILKLTHVLNANNP